MHWRTYSNRTPTDGSGRFSITVRAIPDGRVPPYLAHRVRPGQTLCLGPLSRGLRPA
ncbi:FAD-binding oxidoreductase [Streptomyces coeruleorubidus]